MTVEQLIDSLERLIENGLPATTEVHFATQPRCPFAYSLASEVASIEEEEGKPIVYLREGNQLEYLSADVSQELGWR